MESEIQSRRRGRSPPPPYSTSELRVIELYESGWQYPSYTASMRFRDKKVLLIRSVRYFSLRWDLNRLHDFTPFSQYVLIVYDPASPPQSMTFSEELEEFSCFDHIVAFLKVATGELVSRARWTRSIFANDVELIAIYETGDELESSLFASLGSTDVPPEVSDGKYDEWVRDPVSSWLDWYLRRLFKKQIIHFWGPPPIYLDHLRVREERKQNEDTSDRPLSLSSHLQAVDEISNVRYNVPRRWTCRPVSFTIFCMQLAFALGVVLLCNLVMFVSILGFLFS